MMKLIANLLAKWLLKSGAISADKEELYEYAIYSFLFSSFPIIIIVCIGALFHMVLEGIVMIIPFMLLRKFSGGFHLKSSVLCTISSITLLSLFLLAIRISSVPNHNHIAITTLFITLAAICIYLKSPIDSEERRLSPSEAVAFRKIARGILIFLLVIYSILVFASQYNWATCVAAGIILTAILQLPCFF